MANERTIGRFPRESRGRSDIVERPSRKPRLLAKDGKVTDHPFYPRHKRI